MYKGSYLTLVYEKFYITFLANPTFYWCVTMLTFNKLIGVTQSQVAFYILYSFTWSEIIISHKNDHVSLGTY